MSFSRLRRGLLGLAATAAALSHAPVSLAQENWPSKPIDMIVPFPPGSSPDLVARTIAEPLSAALGQSIVVTNKAGAGGNIGTRMAAQAQPDGHTILFTINGPLVTAPRLYQKTLGYDPVADLAPVSLVATSPNVLTVNAGLDVDTVQDLVELARRDPNRLNYGSVGAGSASHLAMEMMKSEAGIKLLHVPYPGFPQVLTSIIAGDVHAAFMVPAIAMPQVKEGKVKAIAITSLEANPLLPGIAPAAAQGLDGFEAISWHAILVPAGTPKPVIERLNREIDTIIRSERVRTLLDAQYFTPVGGSPDALRHQIQSETRRWTAVIDALGLSLD